VEGFVRDIFANILEMAMCRTFETLPNGVLEEYFGLRRGDIGNLGLNIVPPILQSLRLGPNRRMQFSAGLERSADPDISGWPEVRRKQGAKKNSNYALNRPCMTLSDYENELKRATETLDLGGLRPFNPELEVATPGFDFGQWVEKLRNHVQDDDILYPVGSLQARIGVVLGRSLSLENSSRESETGSALSIPWGIKKIGLNSNNSMIWAADPIPIRMTEGQLRTSHHNQSKEVLRSHNWKLIQGSGMRIVLICGKSLKDILLPSWVLSNKIEVNLRSSKCTGYLEIDEVNEMRRVFFGIPRPPDGAYCEQLAYGPKDF
jgi:hypothetical protein